MTLPLRRLAIGFAAIGLAVGAPLRAQGGRLVGLVQDVDGRPLAGALVRAFLAPPLALPWLEPVALQTQSCRTDERGRFSLASDRRAALWVDDETVAALVGSAAPGVPENVTAERACTVVLGPGARGAHVRIDGVSVGTAAGTEVRLPAGVVELLVESDAGPFVAALELRPGERVAVEPPGVRPPRLRSLPAGAAAHLAAWPQRTFAPGQDGTLLLPASRRPESVRITTPSGAATAVDEVWLEPGEERSFAAPAAVWEPVAVRDGSGQAVAGARVITLRGGPGLPAVTAISVTDGAGRGLRRTGSPVDRIVVLAESFAVAAVWPDRDLVCLQPARSAKLRIVDDDGQPLAGARVATRIDPAIDQVATTDGRGTVTLRGLPPSPPIPLAIEHQEHLPLVTEIAPLSGVLELALARGLELHGVVTCEDRAAVAGAVVEVRASGMQPRLIGVDAHGRFLFRGLPDQPVTLFARCVERGVTWSGSARDVVPGADPVTIAIACDDPPGAGTRRR